jgi:hypothetical protein
VFRQNIGVSKDTDRSFFSPQPPLPAHLVSLTPATTSPPLTSSCHTRSMRRSRGSACSTTSRPRSSWYGRYSPRHMNWPSEGMPKHGLLASPNHDGSDSAKPDLQSITKEPGAYEDRCLAPPPRQFLVTTLSSSAGPAGQRWRSSSALRSDRPKQPTESLRASV